ncbi:hypothetical protein N658DRAFT_405992, partial [Parathielavia hyrcaniae]
AISFEFQPSGPFRQLAKPKFRLRRFQAQATAAAPAKAPALVTPPAPATQVVVPPAPLKMGKASVSLTGAEPSQEPFDFVVLPGEILRSLCKQWIEKSVTFMGEADLLANLTPSWISKWKQDTLVDLGKKLGPNDDVKEFDQDKAAVFVTQFFRHNFFRRMDGPVYNSQGALCRLIRAIAAKEGLDL